MLDFNTIGYRLRKAILAHPRNSIQQKSEFDLKILHGYREIHEDPIYN